MEQHERINSRSLADVLRIVKHGFSFSWQDFQNLVTTSKEIHDALRDTHIQVTVPNSTFTLPAVLTTTVRPRIAALFVEKWPFSANASSIPPWFADVGKHLTHVGITFRGQGDEIVYQVPDFEEICRFLPKVQYLHITLDWGDDEESDQQADGNESVNEAVEGDANEYIHPAGQEQTQDEQVQDQIQDQPPEIQEQEDPPPEDEVQAELHVEPPRRICFNALPPTLKWVEIVDWYIPNEFEIRLPDNLLELYVSRYRPYSGRKVFVDNIPDTLRMMKLAGVLLYKQGSTALLHSSAHERVEIFPTVWKTDKSASPRVKQPRLE